MLGIQKQTPQPPVACGYDLLLGVKAIVAKGSDVQKSVTLQCCGTDVYITVSEEGIAARNPNDVRRNVSCPNCDSLVILSFTKEESAIRVVEQEVIKI